MPPRAARAIGASYGDLWGREDALEEQALEMANGAGEPLTRPSTPAPRTTRRAGQDIRQVLIRYVGVGAGLLGGIALGRKYGFKGVAILAGASFVAKEVMPAWGITQPGEVRNMLVGRPGLTSSPFWYTTYGNTFPTLAGLLFGGALLAAVSKRIR